MNDTLRKMKKELTNLGENVVKDYDKGRIVQDVLRSYNILWSLLQDLEKSQPLYVYRIRFDNHIDKYILVCADSRGRTNAVDVKGVSSTTSEVPASINGESVDKVIRKDKPLQDIYRLIDAGYRLSSLYFEDKEMLKSAIMYDNDQFISRKQQELDNQINVIKEMEKQSLSELETI